MFKFFNSLHLSSVSASRYSRLLFQPCDRRAERQLTEIRRNHSLQKEKRNKHTNIVGNIQQSLPSFSYFSKWSYFLENVSADEVMHLNVLCKKNKQKERELILRWDENKGNLREMVNIIQKVEFGILGKKMTRCDFDLPVVAGCSKASNGLQVNTT